MLLVASNDRQISSPLCTVPHYILPCISAQGSSASSVVWVVLKQHFCGSFQKTTDVCPFSSAAESHPVLIMPFSFSGSPWTTDALSTVCHPSSVTFSLEPIGDILALSASVSRPSSSPYFFWVLPCWHVLVLISPLFFSSSLCPFQISFSIIFSLSSPVHQRLYPRYFFPCPFSSCLYLLHVLWDTQWPWCLSVSTTCLCMVYKWLTVMMVKCRAQCVFWQELHCCWGYILLSVM